MSATQQSQRAPAPQLTPQRIRTRAYEIYEAREGTPGDPVSDWLQAERELRLAVERWSPEVEEREQARGERMLAGGID